MVTSSLKQEVWGYGGLFILEKAAKYYTCCLFLKLMMWKTHLSVNVIKLIRMVLALIIYCNINKDLREKEVKVPMTSGSKKNLQMP